MIDGVIITRLATLSNLSFPLFFRVHLSRVALSPPRFCLLSKRRTWKNSKSIFDLGFWLRAIFESKLGDWMRLVYKSALKPDLL